MINNNNNNINKLEKKSEIPINNNNNNNDNNKIINNDNNINIINNEVTQDEILCTELYNQIIICGHKSGLITLWKPTSGVYLQNQGQQKISDKAINKLLLTKLSDNKDYLILCCGDKTIKILSLENNQLVQTFNYEDDVMDIIIANDYDNQIVFILSLKNGLIKVLNEKFEFLFDIESRFKVNKPRKIIAMKNQSMPQDNSHGDFLLITEGNVIDMYTWIKPKSNKPEFYGQKNNVKNNNNQQHPPHHYPHQQYQQYPNFQGQFMMPHYYKQGGKYY